MPAIASVAVWRQALFTAAPPLPPRRGTMVLGSMFVGLPSPAPDTDFDAPQLDSAAASASQPGAHPRMFLTPEKKLGHDTRPYTAEQ